MLVFDEAVVVVGDVLAPTLFYHSDVTVTGESLEGRYVSSDISISTESWIRMSHMLYYCKVTLSDPEYSWQDVLVPLDMKIRSELQDWGKVLINSGVSYEADPRDSGNAFFWERKYSLLSDFYIPFSSLNGPDWSVGFDMNAGLDYDFVFNQVSLPDRRFRDFYTFSKGTHVGKYAPHAAIQSFDRNNNLASFILGNVPEELFIPLEVLEIMGLFDGYLTGGLPAIWDRNDKELRSYLRSLAITLGRVSGSVLQMKTAIQHLWKNENDYSPDSFQNDLNKGATFRIGLNWWSYINPNLSVVAGTGLEVTPFFYIDRNQRFKISRAYPNTVVGLTPQGVHLVYVNVADTSQSAQVDYVGSVLGNATKKAIFYANSSHNEKIPLAAIETDGAGNIITIIFYQDAIIGASGSSVAKYNSVIRTYATKSRAANLFTNIFETGSWPSYSDFLEEMFLKAFAMDTRVFLWDGEITVKALGESK